MLGRLEAKKKKKSSAGDPESFRFLHEIEALSRALSRALSLDTIPPSPFSSSSSSSSSSLWSKAFSHLRHRRRRRLLLRLRFSLRVHSVDRLPLPLADATLLVHCSVSAAVHTRPSRALRGTAQFDDTLSHRATVRATVSGPRRQVKYDPVPCALWASVSGAPSLNLGRHEIDLARLLPLTLEELEGEKSSARWSTSFRLSGIARGATLNVSFGYSVVREDLALECNNIDQKVSEILNQSVGTGIIKGDRNRMLRRIASIPGTKHVGPYHAHTPSRSVEEVKVLPEVLLSSRLGVLNLAADEERCASKLDDASVVDFEEKFDDKLPNWKLRKLAEPDKGNEEVNCDEAEFVVIEKGVEIVARNKPDVPVLDILEYDRADRRVDIGSQLVRGNPDQQEEELASCSADAKKSSLLLGDSSAEKLDDAFHSILILEAEELETPKVKANASQSSTYTEIKSNYRTSCKESRRFSLDDITESVANEFMSTLEMGNSESGLGYYSDQELSSELIWERFEKEYNFENLEEDFELSSIVQTAELEHLKAVQAMESKTRAKMLEEAEAEDLMRKWGLDEKAFEIYTRGGFGSPIELSP